MIWIAYILLESIIHWYWITKKKSMPFYLPVAIWRGMIAVFYGAFLMDVEANLLELLNWLLTVILPFPFFFNSFLNTWRGKAMDYMGADSGWIDGWVVKHKKQRLYYWVTVLMAMVWVKYFLL